MYSLANQTCNHKWVFYLGKENREFYLKRSGFGKVSLEKIGGKTIMLNNLDQLFLPMELKRMIHVTTISHSYSARCLSLFKLSGSQPHEIMSPIK